MRQEREGLGRKPAFSQFRVKVDSPIYPFSPGTSRTIAVRVR
jgi:hypothetical protein